MVVRVVRARVSESCWHVVALLCLALLAITQVCSLAATYYVASDGVDSPTGGDASNPWLSIDYGDALGLLNSGDTVIVNAGTYIQSVVLTSSSSGVTYQGQPEATVISDGTRSAWEVDDSAVNVKIDSFTIKGGNSGWYGALCLRGTNTEVSNCVIDGDPSGGLGTEPLEGALAMLNSSGDYIHNNVIEYGGADAAVFSQGCVNGSTIVNNTIFGHPSGYCIRLASHPTGSLDSVYNNIIENADLGMATNGSLNHDNNLFYNCNTAQDCTSGANDLFVDPMMDSSYHLCKFSPAIDAGADVGLPYNWLRPDIGAFESTKVGAVFNVRSAVWFPYGADLAIDASLPRWHDDVRAMKKAGLDCVWEVNVWGDYIIGDSWFEIKDGPWIEDMVARLKHRVEYATSQGLMVNIGLAYTGGAANLLVDDAQFDLLRNFVDRIVSETCVYPNVMYTICTELFIGAGFLVTPGNPSYEEYPLWVASFKNWCYNQNSDIGYWNARWGTSFTWDDIMPAYWLEGYPGPRHDDHCRFLYAVQRPRWEDLGDVIKGIAPNCMLGLHEWLVSENVTDPDESPLAGTDTFDFVGHSLYGGLADAQMHVTRLRAIYPDYPLYFCELGTSVTAHEALLVAPYLESEHAGYNWWTWWQTYYEPIEWNLADEISQRRSTFALLPNAAYYGTICGRVTNASTGGNLRFVGVIVDGENVQTVDNGIYRLDLDPGTYTVTFIHPDYTTKTIEGVVVTAGQDTVLDEALTSISNLITNGGFNGAMTGWTTQATGDSPAQLSYDDFAHPAWGFLDSSENETYMVIAGSSLASESAAIQDVTVSPNTTYRLSWWEKVQGSKFDGWSAASADQNLTVSVDQKQVTTWGGPLITLHQVQDITDWKRCESLFTTGPNTTVVRIRFDGKFASGQDFTGAYDSPHIGIDCVQLVQNSEQLIEAASIQDAKNQNDGALVAVTGVGSACFPNASPAFGYVEDSNRICAMKVYTTDTSVGNPMTTIRVVGHISTNALTGEKEITDECGIQNIGTSSVAPLAMVNKSVGKGYGLGTMGLLVRAFGEVKSISADGMSFVIDDGSNTPITVMDYGYDVPTWMQVGSYVEITGISSLESDGSVTVKCLRVPQWYYDTIVPWQL